MAMETRLFVLLWIISFWQENVSLNLLELKLSSLKAEFCFCDWQMIFQLFQMLLGYNFPRIGKQYNKKINWEQG